MERRLVSPEAFVVAPHDLLANRWMLLTAGDFSARQFNSMTIAWGGFGTIWYKPFAQVVVRPTRYTREFMEKYDTFTLCAFPPQCKPALQLIGSKSGRDGNKIAEAGLTPVASSKAGAPVFAEADLVIECRKIYWQDFDPSHFLDPAIEGFYPQKDYHRIYYGEILAIGQAAQG